ncbi:hypothetical protein Q9966_004251, partial [Columba livia]
IIVVSAPDLRHIVGYAEILKLKEDFVVVTTGTQSARKAQAYNAVAVVSLRWAELRNKLADAETFPALSLVYHRYSHAVSWQPIT